MRKAFLIWILAVILLAAGCKAKTSSSGPESPKPETGPAKAPVSVSTVTTQGAPIVAAPVGPTPIAMIPADKRTPAQWMEYLGIRLVETRDSSGPAAWTPEDGGLYFASNESTTWGAANERNGIVVIDAKAKKVVAKSQLPDEYSYLFGSHNLGVSADGKWMYLPSHKGPGANFLLVIDGRTFKINKVYQTLGNPHHINNITLPDGREVIAVVDFGWNWAGSGVWILDPNQDNQVVGGVSRQDLSGHPYILSREFGDYIYVGVPAPQPKYRELEGYLVKVNMKTWKAEDSVPVGDPIWTEISHDGKKAWVTDGGASKVWRIDLEKMKVMGEQLTGPGPWGARLNYDETKLYTADKGEGPGYGQQGRTMTVIDVENNIVTNVLPIGVTTDHILLSPDGKELWATSNAEHKIVIYDAEKEEKITEIAMPDGGDTHGSTFIRYFKDGKGELTGEVVSSNSGLRGSARGKQLALLQGPKPVAVKVNPGRKSSGSPSVFAPASIKVKPGEAVRILFTNIGGTSGDKVVLASDAAGIAKFELKSGGRKVVEIKAFAESGKIEVKNLEDSLGKPFVIEVDPDAGQQADKPANAPAGQGSAREVKLETRQLQFNIKSLKVKAGEKIRFVLTNNDDEKHNLMMLTQGIMSPDVNGGKTGSFDLTMPVMAGTYRFTCTYHPATGFDLIVE